MGKVVELFQMGTWPGRSLINRNLLLQSMAVVMGDAFFNRKSLLQNGFNFVRNRN